MRKIKFRAWSKILNKMLSHEDLNKTLKDLTKIEGIEGIFLPLNSDVDIMQFTGMKDASGKEIYEGDIIKVEERMAGNDFIGKAVYDELEGCYFVIRGNEKSYCKITFDLEDYAHYVIGNIYYNPELLS